MTPPPSPISSAVPFVLDRPAYSRSLNKKESQLYAPLANIGSVVMDQDAMYIDIGRANYTRKESLLLEDGAAAAAESDEGGEGSGDDDDDDEVRGRGRGRGERRGGEGWS